MNKKAWVLAALAALIFGCAGFYVGRSQAATGTGTANGAGKTFVTRGGFAGGGTFGGATIGTVVQVGNGSFTVQLPSSTSSSATTGTKLVLIDNSTQVQELQTVPNSSIQNGQTVTVSGSSNSDGSITASSVQILPAGARRAGSGTQ